MEYLARTSRPLSVLMFVIICTLLIATTLNNTYAANVSPADQTTVEIRNQEEDRLKEQDPAYSRQAKTLAEQYTETAKRVARQGGNPKPLLDAAAYFANQAK